jgi:alanine racemase
MSRPAQAEIDLKALQHNLKIVQRAVSSSRILAVIKANGYGHGMLRVAGALQEADAFGVASIDEAAQLREAGIDKRIVLLEGAFSTDDLDLAGKLKLDLVVHHELQIKMLERAPAAAPICVWLKIDTGMHRLGFDETEAEAVFKRLSQCEAVVKPIVIMTHLANADDQQDGTTLQQIERFNQAVGGWATETSIANSAGIMGWPQSHTQRHSHWVRPGIMLYGISPFNTGNGPDLGLKPVMTVRSTLIAIKQLHEGDPVGYGGTWVCPEDMPVGVVGFGYGDGYPRQVSNGTPVLVNGKRAPLIGRVSMDMLCVDLRGQTNARVGDPVVLWGKGLPAEQIAQAADTIAYDLLCGVTSRVKFVAV